jgi:hypothetical protein
MWPEEEKRNIDFSKYLKSFLVLPSEDRHGINR